MRLNLINIISKKGGTGKTTIALGLGLYFSDKSKTILIDLDFGGTQLLEGIPDLITGKPKDFSKVLFDPPNKEKRLEETLYKFTVSKTDRFLGAISKTTDEDVKRSFPFLYYERTSHYLVLTIEKMILDYLKKSKDEDLTCIFDNGPGILGLAESLLKHEWDGLKDPPRSLNLKPRLTHVVICTPDRPDIFAISALLRTYLSKRLPWILILNKVRDNSEMGQIINLLERAKVLNLLSTGEPRRFDYSPNLVNLFSPTTNPGNVLKDVLPELFQPLGKYIEGNLRPIG